MKTVSSGSASFCSTSRLDDPEEPVARLAVHSSGIGVLLSRTGRPTPSCGRVDGESVLANPPDVDCDEHDQISAGKK